jgi:hypothetical protein
VQATVHVGLRRALRVALRIHLMAYRDRNRRETDGESGSICDERGPLWYALETDWLAEAAGFEPLHFEPDRPLSVEARARERDIGVLDSLKA